MEVELMGRGGRNVEREGGREGGAKPPNFEMEWCFPADGHGRQSGRRKISCVTVAEKPAHCTGTRQTESPTRRSY